MGVEPEASLPFAGLSALMAPVKVHLEGIPDRQRRALGVALALADGPGEGPLATCAGALSVLAAAADSTPVVVLVDDFHWMDVESARIIEFVARRVAEERILVLLATRDRPWTATAPEGIPVLELGALTPGQCRTLAEQSGYEIAPGQLRLLVEATGGNPLGVIEWLRHWGSAENGMRSGEGWAPAVLHESLDRAWGGVLETLPEEVRLAGFVVAADQLSGGRFVLAALDALGLSPDALSELVSCGLIRESGGSYRMRHPLVRTALLRRMQFPGRERAYQALAQVADGACRSWYLTATVTTPDESHAAELEQTAREARARQGLHASARALYRAAELTPDRPMKASRLRQAAHDIFLVGDATTALEWARTAASLLPDDHALTAEAHRLIGRAATWSGQPGPSLVAYLRAAAAAEDAGDPATAASILAETTLSAAAMGDGHQALAAAHRLEDLWRAHPHAAADASASDLAYLAATLVLCGQAHRADGYLHRAQRLLTRAYAFEDLQAMAVLSQVLGWLEQYPLARSLIDLVIHAARQAGIPSLLTLGLITRTQLGWWTGDWPSAYADATEALHWAKENALQGSTGMSLTLLAHLDAARGDTDGCVTRVRQVLDRHPDGRSYPQIFAHAAVGLSALGDDTLDTATCQLSRTCDLTRQRGIDLCTVLPYAGDLAEALARHGDTRRCRQVADWLTAQTRHRPLAYPTAAAHRASAITAPDLDEAEGHVEQALAALARVAMPFERARLLLGWGERLRSEGRHALAQDPLEEALAVFDRLGARPWLDRAQTELAVCGDGNQPGHRTPTRRNVLAALSPQEVQVSRAVAQALSNSEIAEALIISVKTVEAHLTRIYRKTGTRSRTDLAQRVAASAEAGFYRASD